MKHLKLFESFDGFDLNAEFDKLNDKLFDNELKRIPVKWTNTRTRSGALVGNRTVNARTRAVQSETVSHIEISKFFNKTQEQLEGILAHEMIHLWIFQKGIKDNSHHGHAFMNKLRELNKKNVVNIPLTDDVTDEMPADQSPLPKPVVVFYQYDKTRDKKLISLIDKKAFNAAALDSILDTMSYTSKIGKRDFEVMFFDSTDGLLKRYPKTTKFKNAHSLKYMSAPDTASMSKMLEDGVILADFRITGGVVETIVKNL